MSESDPAEADENACWDQECPAWEPGPSSVRMEIVQTIVFGFLLLFFVLAFGICIVCILREKHALNRDAGDGKLFFLEKRREQPDPDASRLEPSLSRSSWFWS